MNTQLLAISFSVTNTEIRLADITLKWLLNYFWQLPQKPFPNIDKTIQVLWKQRYIIYFRGPGSWMRNDIAANLLTSDICDMLDVEGLFIL